MHVAVCIVSYRSAPDVAGCLRALDASTAQDFEVVIVENGGSEAFAELSKALPAKLLGGQEVRLVSAGGNLGYAGGVNLCLRNAPNADAWWVLNPDTAPDPKALEAMIRRLEAGDCDAVGGVLQLPNGRVQSYGGRWRRNLARAVSIGYGAPLERPVDRAAIEPMLSYLTGASMLVSRRFLETVGPMREDYFLYCEEVEWCLRALRAGLRLGFAPDCRVAHQQGAATGNSVDARSRSKLSVYLNERNRLLLTRDCFPGVLPLASLSALALFVLRYGRRGAWRQLAYAFAGWRAGLRGERGAPGRLLA